MSSPSLLSKFIKIFAQRFFLLLDLHRRTIWKSLQQLLQGRARRSYRDRDRNNALCLHLAINHAQASIIVTLNYSLYIFTISKQTVEHAFVNATKSKPIFYRVASNIIHVNHGNIFCNTTPALFLTKHHLAGQDNFRGEG